MLYAFLREKVNIPLTLGPASVIFGNVLPASPAAPAFTKDAYERTSVSTNQEAIEKNMIEVRPV
jgi:hypothetical protein